MRLGLDFLNKIIIYKYLFLYLQMWKTKKMIAGIMDNFPFEDVFKAMEVLNLEWYWDNGFYRPTLEDVRSKAKWYLVWMCEDAKLTGESQSLAIGWFEMEAKVDDEGKVSNVTLRFVTSERDEFRSDYEKDSI